jgi:outer membrane protein OmpA-like peptidoglycan-associated protein
MKKALIYFALSLLLLTNGSLHAQKNHVRQGNKHLRNHHYVAAARSFDKAFEAEEEIAARREIAASIAMSYHKMNKLEEALLWYPDAVGEETNRIDWLTAYADALQRSGKLIEAKTTLEQALFLNPSSQEISRKIDGVELALSSLQLSNPKVKQDTMLNTGFSDYHAAFFDGSVVVSSSRRTNENNRTDGRTGEAYSSLYQSWQNPDASFGAPEPLTVGDSRNTGVFAYDRSRSRAFWTKCKNNRNRCVIMTSSFNRDSFTWSKPKQASFVAKKHHFGHPSVSNDGKWLYFVSDMPGGYGGKDIYRVSMKPDGSFGIPLNLGQPVNTESDELFPFAAGDSLLFFSSIGHSLYGGLDIVYSFNDGKGFGFVEPLLFPFNSYADDFALVMKSGSNEGFFSSARTTEEGDNLFAFDAYPVQHLIKGRVVSADNDSIIAGASIQISTVEGNISSLTGPDGLYIVSVPDYLKGSISASKESFFTESKNFDAGKKSRKGSVTQIDFELYRLDYPVTISGLVTDRETGRALAGEIVEIVGSADFTAAVRTDLRGIYAFDSLKPDQVYTVKIARTGYFTESRLIRIPPVKYAAVFQKATGYDMDFQLIRIQEKQEIVISNIYYDLNKATLRESSKVELSKLSNLLRENPQVQVQINAHTDARGSDAHNDNLSDERARSVVNYLIASGIESTRLISKGHGKRKLLILNARNEDEHQANRRTTFEVVRSDLVAPAAINQQQPENPNSLLVYRVQFMVSATLRNPAVYFQALSKSIPNLRFFVHDQNGLYRYEAGERYTEDSAEALKHQIIAGGFVDCFIVPYLNGNRISIQEAKQIKP